MSQISLVRTSKLTTDKIKAKAKKTFADKHGMILEEESVCCLRFTGGGGFVDITIQEEENQTLVEIKSREWVEVSKDFIKKL
jgi:hypothetical protein